MEIGNTPVPEPKDPESLADQFISFVEIVKILREKCPWDKEQTNESISQLLIEETYEMIEAINNQDDEEFSKELGDVFLHVIMHGVMAEERGAFNNIDVIKKIKEKLVYRHPHVFAGVHVDGEKDVMRNWENLKMKEGRTSILEGVPQHLPALIRAERMQFKASKVGFDWENRDGVWDKITEELAEFKYERDNNNKEKASQELGDILFAIVNAARFDGIEPEAALQYTNDKFKKRFNYIEKQARKQDIMLSDMTLDEMDKYWDEAKTLEKK